MVPLRISAKYDGLEPITFEMSFSSSALITQKIRVASRSFSIWKNAFSMSAVTA